jgi:hypothetical protein
MIVYDPGQFDVAWDILIVIKVELDRRMLDPQGVFDAAGLRDEQPYPALSHSLIVSQGSVSDVAARLDERRPVGGLDDTVARTYFPYVTGFE